MARRDDQFRFRGGKMGAFIADNTIGTIRRVTASSIPDNRIVRHLNGALIKRLKKPGTGRKPSDACRQSSQVHCGHDIGNL